MKFLADYIMRGPLAATVVTSVTALLGLLLPPLGYVSGAAVGLVALRAGLAPALRVIGGAVAATAVLGWLATGNPLLPAAFLLVLWLPLIVSGYSLRRTANLATALLLTGVFGLMVVVGLHLAVDDPAGWWRDALLKMISEAEAPAEQKQAIEAVLNEAAGLMTGLLAAGVTFGTVISLLLARWWQAQLYNPGGFRGEFHRLRFGKAFALITLALLVLSWSSVGGVSFLTDMLPVLLLFSLLQGIALVHGLVAASNAHIGWLIAMYVLLLFPVLMSQAALTLAVAGLVDNWFDFRAFYANKPRGQ